MKLAEYQRLFIASLYQGERSDALFTPETRHRFEAYAGGLRARFEESLRAAFPVTEKVVGHAFFHAAAAGFAEAAPSTTWDLGRVGEGFPAYLAAHRELADHPYVSALARLEAELHEIFFLRDDMPRAGFPADADELAQWRPVFTTTLRLRRYDWPVLEFYERAEAPAAGWRLAPEPQHVLLFRRAGGTASARRLTAAQYALQESVLGGASLSDALASIDALAEADVAGLTGLWVGEGLLRSRQAAK